MLNLETIGKKICEQRKLKGLTQQELAETIYVTHQAVSKWENGKSIPSIEILIELTSLFDITIDYLLDNSEIIENDYPQMFKQFSREAVINKYLNSEDPNTDIDNIFYLLNLKERRFILDKIIIRKTSIKIKTVWPYLNLKERKLLLSVILSNKLNYDLSEIFHHLTSEEKMISFTQRRNKTYKYDLPFTQYNLRSD